MRQITGIHDSAHLWYLRDRTSKILIYATWSRVLRRYTKPNLLLRSCVSKCHLGINGTNRAKPRGHGELNDRRVRYEALSLSLRHSANVLASG